MCPVFDSKNIATKTLLTLTSFKKPVSSASATLISQRKLTPPTIVAKNALHANLTGSSLEQLTRKGIVLVDSELAYQMVTCTQIQQMYEKTGKNTSAIETSPNITKHKMDIQDT